ncbi:MAG: hypothetical protein EZS28_033665 [Streblomastix strix]|uniref:Uncharacterized protein n=1 Tax=Streblomastix strix TaxID=222440 RepID=A0A5J4UJU1_9EUKA|nr:MAG: hypothetical protein EZS28_033665 [Streblomastix strix]
MLVFPAAVRTIAAISFPDLLGLDRKRTSVALVDYCVLAVSYTSPSSWLYLRVVQLLRLALLTSARAAVIAFGGTSSGVAIVQSGSIVSISMFWWNVFTNVGRMRGGQQRVLRYQVGVIRCLVLVPVRRSSIDVIGPERHHFFYSFQNGHPLQTLFGERPEESLQIVEGNHSSQQR